MNNALLSFNFTTTVSLLHQAAQLLSHVGNSVCALIIWSTALCMLTNALLWYAYCYTLYKHNALIDPIGAIPEDSFIVKKKLIQKKKNAVYKQKNMSQHKMARQMKTIMTDQGFHGTSTFV